MEEGEGDAGTVESDVSGNVNAAGNGDNDGDGDSNAGGCSDEEVDNDCDVKIDWAVGPDNPDLRTSVRGDNIACLKGPLRE